MIYRTIVIACFVELSLLISASGQPLKVYVLAGQSNMQGHAQVRTLSHLRMDAQTAPILAEILDDGGQPKTIDQVWISSIGHDGGEVERHGQLSPDYGAEGRGPKIGPEYTFGVYLQKHVQQPILLIKTAWGGKSLHTDFRPPSGGPFEFQPSQLKNLRDRGEDLGRVRTAKVAATGRYYRLMIEHVKNVLNDVGRVCPGYDPDEGHELAGFVWFQGWNDMVDGGVYPNRGKPGSFDSYSELLAHFIRDVRRDLSSPDLPFVIGVMGVGGRIADYGPEQQRYANVHNEFRLAMAAPTKLPEFKDNVTAVLTENYWDGQLAELSRRWQLVKKRQRELRDDPTVSDADRQRELESFTHQLYSKEELQILETGKSNAEYHYLGSGKFMAQIGRAFADAVHQMSGP